MRPVSQIPRNWVPVGDNRGQDGNPGIGLHCCWHPRLRDWTGDTAPPYVGLFLENHNISSGPFHVSNFGLLLQGHCGLEEDIGLPDRRMRRRPGRLGEARPPEETAAEGGNRLLRRRDCWLQAPSSLLVLRQGRRSAAWGPRRSCSSDLSSSPISCLNPLYLICPARVPHGSRGIAT